MFLIINKRIFGFEFELPVLFIQPEPLDDLYFADPVHKAETAGANPETALESNLAFYPQGGSNQEDLRIPEFNRGAPVRIFQKNPLSG